MESMNPDSVAEETLPTNGFGNLNGNEHDTVQNLGDKVSEIDLDEESENLKKELNKTPTSPSIEFTYTTFDSVKEDYSDENPVVIQKSVDEPIQSEEHAEPSDSCPERSDPDLNTSDKKQIDAVKANNKFEDDEFISLVKLNKISNKEVCNHMLNLLVSGEFDLEKNFVIQNVKSILNLIQVIKCAQPTLKVHMIK